MDFKKLYGKQYKVIREEATKNEPIPKEDLKWYYEIPAEYGIFSPYDNDKIAFCCTSNRIKCRLQRLFNLELIVEGDYESVLLLTKEQFHEVAKIAQAKRKRRLTTEQRKEKSIILERARAKRTLLREERKNSKKKPKSDIIHHITTSLL